MSQVLTIYMDKLLREVEEGVPSARRVRLMCEGTTFEIWEPIQGVGIEAKTWASDVETLIAALLPELPKRRIQLSLIAEDVAGATLLTHLRTVTGQNASAQDLGTQNGAKALADALMSVAKTSDSVLAQARQIMEFQAAMIEKKDTQLFEYHELFMAIKKAELENVEEDSGLKKIVGEQLTQALPLLAELGQHLITKASAKAAAAVVTQATNGASATVANAAINGAH